MTTLPPPSGRPIDPLLAKRLAALRTEHPAAPSSSPSPSPSSPKRPAGRRAKPAKASKATALALSAVSTVGLAALFAHDDQTTDTIQLTAGTLATTAPATAAPATAASTDSTAVPTTAATTESTTAATTPATTESTTAATVATTAAATVADGTYVGDASSNRWGTVQVQVVYSGGQIVDVQILSYPDGDRKSVSINQRALPTLISNSIAAQSADVDTVSGATYTSNSYRDSLQSAIDAAKAASGMG